MHTAWRFFFEETSRLTAIEQAEITDDVDANIVAAGIEIFEKYGDVNQLESLSQGDVTRWKDIKALDRGTAFVKLRLIKDKNIFEKAYSALMQAEARR
jgi:hypothetical protein